MREFTVKNQVLLMGAALAVALLSPAAAAPQNTAPGTPVPQAAAGDLGSAIMSAVINADGTIVRGEGVVSSELSGTNGYAVAFGRNVAGCSFQATVGQPGSSGVQPPSIATVAGSIANANAVFVATFDSDNAAAPRPFHLLVYCGR